MKNIKFRAWDYDNECMYDDSQIIIHEGTVFIGRIKFVHQISQDTELMQYTGLKDKNGIEIYEGDIVTHLDFKEPSEVTFSKGCFRIHDFTMANFEAVHPISKTEVIGNIYENSELLND